MKDIHLGELFGPDIDNVSMPFGSINEATGKANQAELLCVSVVAKHLHARNIFEFGTFCGRTTYHLSLASDEATVTTLDLPLETGSERERTLGKYFKGSDREDRIRQIFCDSRKFDPAPFRKKMDFIFVDGDHSYEGVKNDTEKAFEMLAPGGTIMWHDYGPSRDLGLVRFFVEFTSRTPVFRIKKTSLLIYRDGFDVMNYERKKIA